MNIVIHIPHIYIYASSTVSKHFGTETRMFKAASYESFFVQPYIDACIQLPLYESIYFYYVIYKFCTYYWCIFIAGHVHHSS